uniref:Uncharacterized protein n=1 Tax=Trichogramma kaykai TaxID=54128 RepID=A0ABD2XAF2_9HYME
MLTVASVSARRDFTAYRERESHTGQTIIERVIIEHTAVLDKYTTLSRPRKRPYSRHRRGSAYLSTPPGSRRARAIASPHRQQSMAYYQQGYPPPQQHQDYPYNYGNQPQPPYPVQQQPQPAQYYQNQAYGVEYQRQPPSAPVIVEPTIVHHHQQPAVAAASNMSPSVVVIERQHEDDCCRDLCCCCRNICDCVSYCLSKICLMVASLIGLIIMVILLVYFLKFYKQHH